MECHLGLYAVTRVTGVLNSDSYLYHFTGLIFVDAHDHAHHIILYNCAYFVGLMFMVSRSSVKTAKIGPLENFSLYGPASIIQNRDVSLIHRLTIYTLQWNVIWDCMPSPT